MSDDNKIKWEESPDRTSEDFELKPNTLGGFKTMTQKDFIRRAIEQRELVEFLLDWYDDANPYCFTHAAPTGPYLGTTVDESGRTFEDVLTTDRVKLVISASRSVKNPRTKKSEAAHLNIARTMNYTGTTES